MNTPHLEEHSSSSQQHPSRCARMISVVLIDERISRRSTAARSANSSTDRGRSASGHRHPSSFLGADSCSDLRPPLKLDDTARSFCFLDLGIGTSHHRKSKGSLVPFAFVCQEIGKKTAILDLLSLPALFLNRNRLDRDFATLPCPMQSDDRGSQCESWNFWRISRKLEVIPLIGISMAVTTGSNSGSFRWPTGFTTNVCAS